MADEKCFRLKIDWVKDEFGNYYTAMHSVVVGRIYIDVGNLESHVSIRLMGGFDQVDVIDGIDLQAAKEWCKAKITEQLVNGGLLEAVSQDGSRSRATLADLEETERQLDEELTNLRRLLNSYGQSTEAVE